MKMMTLILALALLTPSTPGFSQIQHLDDARIFKGFPRLPSDIVKDLPGLVRLQVLEQLQRESGLSYPGLGAGEAPAGFEETGPVEILGMDVNVLFPPGEEGLRITADLDVRVIQEGVDNLVFQLEPFEIDECTGTMGEALDCEYSGNRLRVGFPEALVQGSVLKLHLAYHGNLDCSLSFMLPPCGLDSAIKYITHAQYYPVTSSMTDRFTATLSVTLVKEDGLIVGGTGTFTGSHDNPDSTRTFVFEHTFETDFLSFAFSRFERWLGSAEALGVPLSVFAPKGKGENAGALLELMEDVLNFYSQAYVPYPWNKLDIVGLDNSFSGGYGPLSTVMVAEFIFNQGPEENNYYSVVSLISHEIAHQWWGNFINLGSSEDVMLSESFAEFSSARYVDYFYNSRYQFATNGMYYMYGVSENLDTPMNMPMAMGQDNYFAIIYQKGSMVVDMLRWELGEEVFDQAIQAYLEEFGGWFGSLGTLLDTVNEVSGRDLTWFFDQWIYSDRYPRPQITTWQSQTDEGWVLRFRIEQLPGRIFRFNLPIRYLCGDEERWTDLLVDSEKAEVDLEPCPVPVSRVDPDLQRRIIRHFIPGRQGDVNLDGGIDGDDLLELAFYHRRGIVMSFHGTEYLYPDIRYREFADIAGGTDFYQDGLIDMQDIDGVISRVGKDNAKPIYE